MPQASPSKTLGAVTPADFEKLAQLRKMKALALGLLILMAIIFIFSFSLQERYEWLAYVRAASEGGMVGAIADWFAVTALFRYPLGIKIPHTNIVATKKDEIGAGLGTFIEDNFLSQEVVHEKLSTISGARLVGTWLTTAGNAPRVGDAIANIGLGAITVLDDEDVRELIEGLTRRHLIDPVWGPTLSRGATSFLDGGHHEALIDLAADRLGQWLENNPQAFDKIVSGQLPSWVPSMLDRFIDNRAHHEAVRFVRAVRDDAQHPVRGTIGTFLRELATDLQHKQSLIDQVEAVKHDIFDSPRVRSLTESTWQAAKHALTDSLTDPTSELRVRIDRAAEDFGRRLLGDTTLQYKIDVWVMGVAEHLVGTYRHDIANVVAETVQRWDAREAAEKIELQVGKDLQFIRINGTVVGSLAGLVIFTIAHNLVSPLFA
ncbi:DUF445 domain-containing protein [Leucobacter sp. M11]|uniref:DUF445 domain-containing protein n=1 Tax=Leucobacter sp. M11 TaxID=2993565 RepID=UPI002D80105F|nr:DUF445 family protein [Leucobacter sp. M11]MEB4614516.1 DUF445 family protein [Leucobacter sp. M11]